MNKLVGHVDGCIAQYRCGSVLRTLEHFAYENNIKYDRAVLAPGHGKGVVDASY